MKKKIKMVTAAAEAWKIKKQATLMRYSTNFYKKRLYISCICKYVTIYIVVCSII